MVRTLVLILLVLLLLGALPTWPYSAGWGYYPSSGLGLVLIILIILALTFRRRPGPVSGPGTLDTAAQKGDGH